MKETKRSKNMKIPIFLGSFNFLLPASLTIILFVVTTHYIALPHLKENIIDSKKEILKDTTDIVFDILVYHNKKVVNGELSLSEAKKKVKSILRSIRYGDEHKDYFWISDLRPVMIMHPYVSSLEGKDVSQFEDENGKKLFFEFIKATEKTGSGFTSYVWQWQDNPSKTGNKLSFVRRFEDWGWIIGTGIYLDDMESQITLMITKIRITFMVILLIVTILCVYIIFRIRKTEEKKNLYEVELIKKSKELKKLSFVASKTDNAVIIIGSDGKIEWVNESFTKITEYSSKEALGKSPSSLLNGEKTDENTVLKMKNALKNKEPVNVELCNYTKTGRIIWLNIEVKPVLDEMGEVSNYIAIEKDITDRMIAEREKEMAEKKIKESAALINEQNDNLKNAYRVLKNEVREREKAEIALTLNREKLRALTSEIALSEEKERRKIAIELHDGVCQTLAMVKMRLEMLKGQVESSLIILVSGILLNVEELINETRTLAINLSPPALYELGLKSAIEELIDNLNDAYNINFNFVCDGDLSELSKEIKVLIFQSVKELLTNAIKHSNANIVNVNISFNRKVLKVFIEDDGIGMRDIKLKTTRYGGFGIFSIKERLNHMGGSLRYKPKDKGVCFTIYLPVNA